MISLPGTYQAIASTPIATVEKTGVKNRFETSPKAVGIASWRAIDSEVRAAGRIVVWVEASAETTTASSTILPVGSPRAPVRVLAEDAWVVVEAGGAAESLPGEHRGARRRRR